VHARELALAAERSNQFCSEHVPLLAPMMHSYCEVLLQPFGGRHVQSGRPPSCPTLAIFTTATWSSSVISGSSSALIFGTYS